MQIETCKGSIAGNVFAVAAWLEVNQPAFARVVCPCEFGGVEIEGDEWADGYEDGPALHAALRRMDRAARAECCEAAR